MFLLACNLTKNDVQFFARRHFVEKNTWKRLGFFNHRNYVEKCTWNRRELFEKRNHIKKVCANYVEIRRNLIFDVST